MMCPICQCRESAVVDSRITWRGTAIRRRRECMSGMQGHRWTTIEIPSRAVIPTLSPRASVAARTIIDELGRLLGPEREEFAKLGGEK